MCGEKRNWIVIVKRDGMETSCRLEDRSVKEAEDRVRELMGEQPKGTQGTLPLVPKPLPSTAALYVQIRKF